jgi:hypothetical protein
MSGGGRATVAFRFLEAAIDTHVKVLGALNVVLGAFGLLLAAAMTLIFGGATWLVGAAGDPDAALAVPILSVAGAALSTFLLVLSLPAVIIGIGLLQRRSWARIAGIVISLLNLFNFPFGTVLGVYGLWVLFSKETERIFNQSRQPVL